eukprot:349678-Chlamydomonas_euryale.AAC.2
MRKQRNSHRYVHRSGRGCNIQPLWAATAVHETSPPRVKCGMPPDLRAICAALPHRGMLQVSTTALQTMVIHTMNTCICERANARTRESANMRKRANALTAKLTPIFASPNLLGSYSRSAPSTTSGDSAALCADSALHHSRKHARHGSRTSGTQPPPPPLPPQPSAPFSTQPGTRSDPAGQSPSPHASGPLHRFPPPPPPSPLPMPRPSTGGKCFEGCGSPPPDVLPPPDILLMSRRRIWAPTWSSVAASKRGTPVSPLISRLSVQVLSAWGKEVWSEGGGEGSVGGSFFGGCWPLWSMPNTRVEHAEHTCGACRTHVWSMPNTGESLVPIEEVDWGKERAPAIGVMLVSSAFRS